jgi:putative selenate reductase molybdopterin-binding subunit
LATLRTGQPTRIELTREEEFVSARLMHPMEVSVQLGANQTGKLKALSMEVLSNTGAYGTHGATVFFNTGSKTLPLYNKAEHVRFRGDVVYTNMPVPGAYRGYGATEGYFALECAIDQLARELGLDPLEFRHRNHIRQGESSPIFRKLGEGREGVDQVVASCGLERCIELGAKTIGWEELRQRPRQVGPHTFRGVGMGIFMQGSAIPLVDMAAATLRMNEDGSFLLFIGATDIGTGSDTILAQVAAEVLGVPLERFVVYSSDTDLTPFDKGAYASSTTFLSGEAVRRCALNLGRQIVAIASKLLNESPDVLALEDGGVCSMESGKRISLTEIGLRTFYLADQKQLEASASHVAEVSPPPFAAHFADVEVDTETGVIRPLRYVAAVDCGFPLNPGLARGQILGSLVNGLGFALYEELRFSPRGVPLNPNFLDYKIPTSLDLPQIETILVPTEEPAGPFGAKSVGEICINGPLPVIANAVFDAVGIQLKRAPFTPEAVLRLLGRL